MQLSILPYHLLQTLVIFHPPSQIVVLISNYAFVERYFTSLAMLKSAVLRCNQSTMSPQVKDDIFSNQIDDLAVQKHYVTRVKLLCTFFLLQTNCPQP